MTKIAHSYLFYFLFSPLFSGQSLRECYTHDWEWPELLEDFGEYYSEQKERCWRIHRSCFKMENMTTGKKHYQQNRRLIGGL